jgi:spermidine/putrescine transport system substrate-binding protein
MTQRFDPSTVPSAMPSTGPAYVPAYVRGLTRPRRRDVLKLFGAAGAGLALAGCGVEGRKATPPEQNDVQRFWAGKKRNGHVDFANWPLYMDPKKPELAQFTRQTGISVTYREVIQENAGFFAKMRPQLAAGRSIGYDIIVITNGIQFTQLTQLGYVAPLDHRRLPNFARNAAPAYKREAFDPGNVYSVPWATGITGIAYNPKYVKEEITGLAALFDPKYKGKVGMFSDTQEIGNFGMLAVGADPEKSTPADWRQAAARLTAQRDAGIVRKYYDQGYVDPLTRGDIWISMAWSGDIFQKNLEGAGLEFVIPQEGGTIWTDNMMIPKTAPNPVDALMLMDFFFDPEVAAGLAEYINYVTPVPGAKQVMLDKAATLTGEDRQALADLAESPLVFPAPADYARLNTYRDFKTPQEQRQYESVFQPIVTS